MANFRQNGGISDEDFEHKYPTNLRMSCRAERCFYSCSVISSIYDVKMSLWEFFVFIQDASHRHFPSHSHLRFVSESLDTQPSFSAEPVRLALVWLGNTSTSICPMDLTIVTWLHPNSQYPKICGDFRTLHGMLKMSLFVFVFPLRQLI